jgi:hypothetical protein
MPPNKHTTRLIPSAGGRLSSRVLQGRALEASRDHIIANKFASGWKLDRRDVDQHKARSDFGIRHAYRTDDMEANYSRHQKREGMIVACRR